MLFVSEGTLLRLVVWLPLAALVVVVSTRLITGLQYHISLRQLQRATAKGHGSPVEAPVLPYWIPVVGHASLFLSRKHGGQFWARLLAQHPRDAGICTLQAGGKRIHLLWNVTAINDMFKNRANVNKGGFDRDLWTKAFAMSPQHYESMQAHHHTFHDLNSKLLMRRNAVDELTAVFIEHLVKQFEAQPGQAREVSLWEFIRSAMFEASVDTSFGTRLRQDFYPQMIRDFDKYDADMPSFYYGLPRFMAPSMYANREKILERMKAWNESNRDSQPKDVVDAGEGPRWGPDLGSRYNRARHAASAQAGFSTDADAAADMAFVMGLSANVIRTTGWMMLNVVGSSDSTLLPRVLQEVEKAKLEGSKGLDVDKLVTSPLLQSLWTEALRCYIDNYTPRDVVRSTHLPMDEFGRCFVRLNAGDMVFVANYPVQTDPTVWGEDSFRAERFVTTDVNGVETFQHTSKASKIFAFGGGPEKCPGRIFAKQEAIAAIGLFFSHFDIERKGMVDGDGNPTDRFPIGAPMAAGGGAQCPEGDIRVRISKRV